MAEMNEKPILMCAEMVRATLDDRKTMTRRITGLELINKDKGAWRYDGVNIHGNHLFYNVHAAIVGHDPQDCVQIVKCPYGIPDSHLWVRETWRHKSYGGLPVYPDERHEIRVEYLADAGTERASSYCRSEFFMADPKYATHSWTKKPSIFMPHWASRITLEITDIKVERVADISKEDAKAEGIQDRWHPEDPDLWTWKDYGWHCERFAYGSMFGARESFFGLWDSINAKRGFGVKVNPFVWAISFRRIKP
jgi:hypothetical protein